MNYFVTGATGFVGKFFVEKLLQREGTIHVLVRKESAHKLQALRERFPGAGDRIVPVHGDLTKPLMGVSDADRKSLRGNIDHFFHIAAIYDLTASEESQFEANVEGTRNAVQCAEDLKVGCFQHVSSIAVGGKYNGTFREDMFEEAGELSHPYFYTKHESEAVVRKECSVPYRIYRPASVVGHSKTGEADKIDGPYYCFKPLQKLRKTLPPWFPLVGLESGSFNIVPVDYVVDAMDHIAHQNGLDGECFHLTDTAHYSAGQMMNIFSKAGDTPGFAVRLDTKVFSFIPSGLLATLTKLPPVKRFVKTAMEGIGMPESAGMFFSWTTEFDNRAAERALKGSGIAPPKLASYADKLWDYWARNLDPDLFIDKTLKGNIAGKIVVITGAGTGIGKASALRLAEAGAKVVICGRTLETLDEVKKEIEEIEEIAGECHTYTCDISSLESCDEFIAKVIEDHGQVDVLINNAGRSIRRAVEHSYDRFHDFERTMQLNFFGCLRLTLNVLPGMSERRDGHIINISSMGVVGPPARFSAYIASKSALEGWTRCAESEFCDQNIHFTNINMPLVRTPMIGPTKAYDYAPTLTPEEAADMVVDAVINKPSRITTGMGTMFQILNLVAPKMHATMMNVSFRMFDDSSAAMHTKRPAKGEQPTSEQVALAQLMKGVHF